MPGDALNTMIYIVHCTMDIRHKTHYENVLLTVICVRVWPWGRNRYNGDIRGGGGGTCVYVLYASKLITRHYNHAHEYR